MTQSLKRFASAVLALVMAMTCLVFTNVASVSAADDDTASTVYKFYANDTDATNNSDSDSDNASSVFTDAAKGTKNVTGTVSLDDKSYTFSKGTETQSLTIVVPEGMTNATFNLVAKSSGSSARTLTLAKEGADNVTAEAGATLSVISFTGLSSGTYTLTGTGKIHYTLLVLTAASSSDNSTTTTETTTETSTTETTTETTTTTTTEATTEATTVANQTLYKYYVNAADATANDDSIDNNASTVFTDAKTSTNRLSGESTVAVGGKDYTLNYRSSNETTLSIVVPDGVENATLYVVARSSSSTGRALTLTKGTETVGDAQSTGGTTPVVATYEGLSTGTYTLTSNGNMQYSLLVLSVPTTVGTTTTTTETTTETTTTTTTEATTEATTVSGDYVAIGSYELNESTIGNDTTGTYNGMTYNLSSVEADHVRLKNTHSITFKVAQDCTVTATITSGSLTINGEALENGKAYSLVAGKEYTIAGATTSNSRLSKLVFATGSTDTSTETTTATTTEATTEATTIGVLSVKVNNPANSSTSTVKVTVKKNGTTISDVTALSIGSATEIAGVGEDDVITFTFVSAEAKKITNWDSNLKSKFRDKTYTLTYTVGKTVATPEMDYYDSMPAAVSLGQSATTAVGYGTYGFGQYKVQSNGNDLAKYAIIKGHQYSLYEVGSGDYDKDGTEHGIPDERILLLGGTDDEIELTNNIGSSEKLLVLLDCSGDEAIVTATNGNLYTSYDGSTGTTAESVTGISKNGVKLQFYVDGGTTITVKGTGTKANAYTVVKSIRLFNLNNIVDGDKKVDNGAVSEMTEDSPFYNVVTSNSLATTDKLFTLIGTVTGNHKDSDFLSQIDKVGFVILDADTVDKNDPNGQYTPMQLKYNFGDVFGGIYVETTDIYKNVYDATNYDSSLDSSEEYTGDVDADLTTGDNIAYFAELVSVSSGNRYYAYPFTMYTGGTQRAYDTNPKGTRIEISNN